MRVEDTDVRCVFLKQTLHVSLPVLHIEPAEVKGSRATQSPWSYFMVLCRELSLFSNLTIRDASTFWTETNKPSSYLDWESNYVFLKITDHPTKLRNKQRTTFHTRMIESMKQMCCWVYSYVHLCIWSNTYVVLSYRFQPYVNNSGVSNQRMEFNGIDWNMPGTFAYPVPGPSIQSNHSDGLSSCM